MKAIDGIAGECLYSSVPRSLAQTDLAGPNDPGTLGNWWRADIGSSKIIGRLVVHERLDPDFVQHFKGFKVTIGMNPIPTRNPECPGSPYPNYRDIQCNM